MHQSKPVISTTSESLSPQKFAESTKHAIDGVGHAYLYEHSFMRAVHFELVFAAILGWFFGPLFLLENPILFVAAALVLITEILNTSIESLADWVTTDESGVRKWNPMIKVAKDCAAGATLLATLFGILIVISVCVTHSR